MKSSCSLAALSKSDWSLNTDSESDAQTDFTWPSRYSPLGMLLASNPTNCPLSTGYIWFYNSTEALNKVQVMIAHVIFSGKNQAVLFF